MGKRFFLLFGLCMFTAVLAASPGHTAKKSLFEVLKYKGALPLDLYVKKLVREGADLNERDKEGRTPLIAAIRAKETTVVQALLNAGADVHAADNKGRSAIHYAACSKPDILALLLRAKSDVNAGDDEGMTPLMFACDKTLVRLLKAGAELDGRDREGRTALMRAVARGNVGMTRQFLAAGGDANAKDRKGRSVLHYAFEAGDPKIVIALLKHGADPNVPVGRKGDPLLVAIARGESYDGMYKKKLGRTVVDELLAHGADINARGRNGDTALHRSIPAYNTDKYHALLAVQLLDGGADCNTKNDYGKTPVMRMKRMGWKMASGKRAFQEIFDRCFLSGWDVNAQDNEGKTVLMHLFEPGYGRDEYTAAKIKALLAGGATVSPRDEDGRTVFQYAVRRMNDREKEREEQRQALQALVEHGADPNEADRSGGTALESAIAYNNPVLAKFLLEKGADCGTRDTAGKTPLMHLHSRSFGSQELAAATEQVMDLCLKAGGDLNAQDNEGRTVLMHIARDDFYKQHDTVAKAKALLARGAKIDIKDKQGLTAFSYIVRHLNGGKEDFLKRQRETVQFFLENGADVNAKTEWGSTAMHKAMGSWHARLGLLLLDHGGDCATAVRMLPERAFEEEPRATNFDTLVKRCVGSLPDVNTQDCKCKGKTLLMSVINRGFGRDRRTAEIVKMLLDRGAKVDLRDDQGNTAIRYALKESYKRNDEREEQKAVLRMLVQHGADPDDQGGDLLKGQRPLHYYHGEAYLVRELIGLGADVNSVCRSGKTPLMHALEHEYHQSAELLRKAGAQETSGAAGSGTDSKENEQGPAGNDALRKLQTGT